MMSTLTTIAKMTILYLMIAFTMHWRVAWSMLPKPDALFHGPGTTQESVQTQMMSRKPSEFPGSEELTRYKHKIICQGQTALLIRSNFTLDSHTLIM